MKKSENQMNHGVRRGAKVNKCNDVNKALQKMQDFRFILELVSAMG